MSGSFNSCAFQTKLPNDLYYFFAVFNGYPYYLKRCIKV